MSDHLVCAVCRHYQKELASVLQEENLLEIETKIYLPGCIYPSIKADLAKQITTSNNIFLINDNCYLAEEIQKVDLTDSPQQISLNGNCLQALVGKELLDYYSSEGGYLVSPGWLRYWKETIHQWDFDQTTAMQFFSEFAKKVIALDTGLDPTCSQNLTDFSAFVGLPFQLIPVGLDHFRLAIKEKIHEKQHKYEIGKLKENEKKINQQVADFALAFDLITNLARTMNEIEAVAEVVNTFKMLFSPKEIVYIVFKDKKLIQSLPREIKPEIEKELLQWLNHTKDDFYINDVKDSFYIRISHHSDNLGVVAVYQVAFPEYHQRYLSLALEIAPLFGLAISKARDYQKIQDDETLLRSLASTDSLTGLFNRRYFLEAIDKEFSRAKRYHSPMSVVLMDIDYFKQINDTYGHPKGDEVLISFAKTIAQGLRKSDIVARLGGDEFVILLPETSLEKSKKMSQRLCQNISRLNVPFKSGQITITSSIGVADYGDNCNSVEDLLHRCDRALYNAKEKGRNRVEFWHE